MYARLRALGDGGEIYTFKEWNLGPLSEMKVYKTDLFISR